MRIEFVCLLLVGLALPSVFCSVLSKPGALESPKPGQACHKAMNPFMPALLSQGVRLNSEPSKQTSRCGLEWKTHGTCCDEASVVKYATEEDKELRKNSQSLVSEVRGVITAIRETVFRMESQRDKFEGKKKLGAVLKAVISAVGNFIKSALKNIGDLVRVNVDLIREKKDIEKFQASCLGKVQQLRSASLCSICSGRSQVFFKDTRALIDLQTCRSVVSECHEYWQSLVKLIQTATKAADSINRARQVLKIPPKTSALQFLKDWIEEVGLEAGLARCATPANCADTDAARLCEALVRIQGLDSLEVRTASVLGGQTKSFEHIAQLIDPSKTDPQVSNFRRRLSWADLQEQQAFAKMSFGDVYVVPDSRFFPGLLPMDSTLRMP